MARQNTFAESWSEALDLRLNGARHIGRRAVGNVTVGPYGVLSCGGAHAIEQARLRQQHKRRPREIGLPCSDLIEGSAHMHSGCAKALTGPPRDGTIQR